MANINVVWQLFQSLLHLQQTRHVCPKLIFNNEKALTLKTKKKKEKFNSFDISLSKPTEIIPRRLYVPSQETSTSLSAWALDSLLPRFQNGTKKGKRWKEPSAYQCNCLTVTASMPATQTDWYCKKVLLSIRILIEIHYYKYFPFPFLKKIIRKSNAILIYNSCIGIYD